LALFNSVQTFNSNSSVMRYAAKGYDQFRETWRCLESSLPWCIQPTKCRLGDISHNTKHIDTTYTNLQFFWSIKQKTSIIKNFSIDQGIITVCQAWAKKFS